MGWQAKFKIWLSSRDSYTPSGSIVIEAYTPDGVVVLLSAALFSILIVYVAIAAIRSGGAYVSDVRIWFAMFMVGYAIIGPALGTKRIGATDIERYNALLLFCSAAMGLIISLFLQRPSTFRALMEPRILEGVFAKYLMYSALLGAAASLAFAAVEFQRAGGIGTLTSMSRGQRIDQMYSESEISIPYYSAYLASFCTALGLIVHGRRPFSRFQRRSAFVLICLTTLMVFFVLLLAKRSQLLYLIISFVVVMGLRYRGKFHLKPVMLLVTLGLTFHIVGASRNYIVSLFSQTEGHIETEKLFEPPGEFIAPATSLFFYMESDPELRLGRTYWDGVWAPIPRIIYPGQKPVDIHREYSEEMAEVDEVDATRVVGLAMVPAAEAYLNFGQIGPFIVYFIYGALLGVLIWFGSNLGWYGYLAYPLLLTGTVHIANRTPFCSWTTSVAHKLGAFTAVYLFGLVLYRLAKNAKPDHE